MGLRYRYEREYTNWRCPHCDKDIEDPWEFWIYDRAAGVEPVASAVSFDVAEKMVAFLNSQTKTVKPKPAFDFSDLLG
jgi:hypothetical protein